METKNQKEQEQFRKWFEWYTSPPEDWRKKYGDAFVWTEQEKMLMKQTKGNI